MAKLRKDQEFIDVQLTNGQQENGVTFAHKFVLAGLSTLLAESLASIVNYDEDITIIIPDFDMETLEYFVLLTYGLAQPTSIDLDLQESILELCQLLGLASTTAWPLTSSAIEEPGPILTAVTAPTPAIPQVTEFQDLDKVWTILHFTKFSRQIFWFFEGLNFALQSLES